MAPRGLIESTPTPKTSGSRLGVPGAGPRSGHPVGTITSFDKVSIDTILIRLFQLTLIYIGVLIYMFDECSMQDAKNIGLTLPNYILACLILSSEILNSSFRILFLRKQHWLDETSNTNIRRMAWVIRIIIAGR